MNKLKPVGFFSDLPHGSEDAPALHDSLGDSAPQPEVIAYLRAGVKLAVAPMTVRDIFNPRINLGAPALLTDGMWYWPSDLAYYVERYRCRLPEEFVAHMRASEWRVPADLDLDAIEAELFPDPQIKDVEKFDG